MRVGYHVSVLTFLCLTIPKNISGSYSLLQKISGSENLLGMRLAISGFFRWIFLISHYGKNTLRTLRSFWKVVVAKSLYGWEKGMSGFFHRNLLYNGTNFFHWKFFGYSEDSCYGKKYMDKTGNNTSSVKISCLAESNFIVGITSKILKVWGIEKFLWLRGKIGYHVFKLKKILSYTTRKIHWELFDVSEKFCWRKIVWMTAGNIRFLC